MNAAQSAIELRAKQRADSAKDVLRMKELRTPQPVSIKLIHKSFEQLAL
jgi:hypothetical protein